MIFGGVVYCILLFCALVSCKDESVVPVRKCCRPGEAFWVEKGSCAPHDDPFIVKTYFQNENIYSNLSESQMSIHAGLLTWCVPSLLSSDEFVLFDSGQIFSSYLGQYIRPENFCLENIVESDNIYDYEYLDTENDTLIENDAYHIKNNVDFSDFKEETHRFISDPIKTSVVPTVRLSAAYCPSATMANAFNKVVIRKCCSRDEIVSRDSMECSSPAQAEYSNAFDRFVRLQLKQNSTNDLEIVSGYPECFNHERGEALPLSSWNLVLPSGLLHVPQLATEATSYCVDARPASDDNQTDVFAYVCLNEAAHNKFKAGPLAVQSSQDCTPGTDALCLSKCCPLGQILGHGGTCVTYKRHFPMPIKGSNASIRVGPPDCGERGMFRIASDEKVLIEEDGFLQYSSVDPTECPSRQVHLIPPQDYCYETILPSDPSDPSISSLGALLCYPRQLASAARAARVSSQVDHIYAAFLAISDVFILASFIIYLTVPDDNRRTLNKNVKLGHSILGRILLSFLASLFLAYLCLIVVKTASNPINLASKHACAALGVAMYVSFLSTFFWLNVLCFEVWWKCARQERTSGRRWLWYRVYGWCFPLLLGAIVLCVEFAGRHNTCVIRPNFGVRSCFFSETQTYGSAAKWLYFNGPVAVLLLADLCFFLLTVKSLLITVNHSHKKTVQRQARQRLKLCFKLFLVMGICWLTEIVSAAVGSSKWYFAEVFNCMQGFVIFMIFILKPKILRAIQRQMRGTSITSSRGPLRSTLSHTASVLSEFLASSKRPPHPPLSSPSSSTSTLSSTLSSSLRSTNSGISFSGSVGRYPPIQRGQLNSQAKVDVVTITEEKQSV